MNVFTTDKIRNVVLLGHGGCGKTSLAEAMAYLAGVTGRMGSTANGNTLSDYDKEEVKRGISINTTLIAIPWEDYKINLAKRLLTETDLTVNQIAAKLNYTNAQNFIRFFSKKEGTTPGKYRQSVS